MSKPSKLMRIMSSVRPSKMWIDGRCFEIGKANNKSRLQETSSSTSETVDEFEHFDISSLDDGQFSTAFRMPTIYYEKLTTLPNFTLENLQSDTNTIITVPKLGSDGNVVVTGKSMEEVGKARLKLQSVFSLIRDRYIALQFVSIPVFSDEVKSNFQKFKERIVCGEKIDGLHESIFQKPEKLHLTIAVFALMDEIEKLQAIKALDDCKQEILDPVVSRTGPLKIKVAGIECMNAEYSKVNVLYANANFLNETEEHTLQKITNSISSHFYERGLVRKFEGDVKLHVTLMNTKYRKVSGRKRKWADKKLTFDARSIMEKYKDYHFDVINKSPPNPLEVIYPGGEEVQTGNELTPTQVKDEPIVKWRATAGKYYTLLMVDPDAPSKKVPILRSVNHWLIGNITGNNLSSGETIAVYAGAGPPKHTGLHRYVFLLFEYAEKIQFNEPCSDNSSIRHRIRFNTKLFIHKYNLGDPIAGNFFLAQWDPYVAVKNKGRCVIL